MSRGAKRFTIFVLPLLVLLAACERSVGIEASAGGAGKADPQRPPICQTLDGFLSEDPAATGTVTGYSFLLFDRESTLLSCAGGDATLETARNIASASKLPSAAAILTLVDRGLLNLDRPIINYLRFSNVNWPNDKRRITLRQLLSHTSGLPGLKDRTNPDCIEVETGIRMEECIQLIANLPLSSEPGTAFNYGGTSYQVAGFIATLVTGKNWETFFREAIADPVGMPTYTYGNPLTVTNPRVAGGGYSDVGDYAKFLRMILVGGRAESGNFVLSPGSVGLLLTNQIAGREVQFAPVDTARFPGYTLGFFISDPSLHPGSVGPEYSDPGLFGTTPWIDVHLGYGAVILIGKTTFVGLDMWDAVRPQIIEDLVNSEQRQLLGPLGVE